MRQTRKAEEKRRSHPLGKAALILILSFFNLLGAFLAVATLGGLGEWSDWQFIGLFGFIEAGMGLAFIVGPNIWRLPVAEANTDKAVAVRLAPSILLIPQWGSATKVLAGVLMMAGAAWSEGWAPRTLTVVPGVMLLGAIVLAISLLVARLGVARPDLDVVSLVIRRPGHPEHELPAVSLGGMFVQFLTQIGVFPLVKLAAPSILYAPALSVSTAWLGLLAAVAVVSTLLALLVWRGRIDMHAPVQQQLEVEQELAS
jgi:hypothetical protein